MGREKAYFLVARKWEDNTFQIIPTGKYHGSSLEEIDLFTTCYDNSFQLTKDLLSKGKISSSSVDFYIASKGKNSSIQTLEVLYSDQNRICSIANHSMHKNIQKSERDIHQILNSFCYRMEHDSKFYDYVLFGENDLYPKFVRYFYNKRFEPVYDVKYKDGGWVTKSYVLIRSILDSFSEYDGKKYSKLVNGTYRSLLERDLLPVLDRNYDENQLTWDSFDNISEKQRKVTEIMKVLDTMGVNTFVSDGFEFSFSKEEFQDCDENDLNLLSTLIPPVLRAKLYFYLNHRDILMSLIDSGENSIGYEKLFQKKQSEIMKVLSSSDQILEDTYRFCLLYNKVSKGDMNGRSYQKT